MSLGESATPLGKVEGLGSSHHGGHHWLEERFTSVALLLLSLWLIFSLIMLPALDRQMLGEWLRSAWGAVPMALFILTAFKHGVDGLKVAVDDYLHDEGNRVAIHFALDMAGIAGAAASLFALARIAFTPVAA
jgi:succinate dehydrogenase / fumarate reductase, membrane anchor subunit